jgi:hypothetical protein
MIRISIAALVAVVIAHAAVARGERVQMGNLIVSMDGKIVPRTLPREHVAPVAIELGGGVSTSDGSPLPRVNWIRLELAWRGKLDRRGLPVCSRATLKYTDSLHALRACRGALVGHGWLSAKIFVPNQAPFGVHAHLLAFNGRGKGGRPAIWVHAYAGDPPVSFVLPFTVRHKPGSFRTVLLTTIRRSVGPWPHVADFEITVSRHFRFQGREHSYLTASCPIPRNFKAGFISLARATYTFADGRQARPQIVRSCRARG